MLRRLQITLIGFALTILLTTGETNAAAPPLFDPPLDCLANADCFIQKYVDHEIGPGVRDYRCGPLSGNGHKGTDFRLANFEMMERGVSVRAGADGVIVAIRKGMPDVHVALVGKGAVLDRGLGNAVVIDHGDGWRSTYGHLRRGSISVAKGRKIRRGEILGQVGLSGLTEFPHVHFQIIHNGAPVDPFTGTNPSQAAQSDGCRAHTSGSSLWREGWKDVLAYKRIFLLHAGFSNKPMKRAALQYGLYGRATLPRTAKNFLFGVFFAGAREGDVYRLRLFEPSGGVLFDKAQKFTKDSPVRFIFGGKTNRATPWPVGEYHAVFDIRSAGDPVLTVKQSVQIR